MAALKEVFISKSKKDDTIANAICNVLEKNNISCWIAPRDITPGLNYAAEIIRGIENAAILLVIVSQNSNESGHVLNEINRAVEVNKIILPFKIDATDIKDDFKYYLDKTQSIDAFPETSKYFSVLVKNISILLGKKMGEDAIIEFADDEYKKKMNYDRLRRETQEKRFAFARSLEQKAEEEIDKYHFYDKITRIDVVESYKSRWSSYRFVTLINVSDIITHFIIHRESGENKTEFSKMRIRARLGDIKGQKLRVESATDIQPNFDQLFKIYFPKPLKPGESISIFYRLDWPNEPDAYFKGDLTQSISLTRYARGVCELEFAVFEPYRIGASSMDMVDTLYQEGPSNCYPVYLDIQEEKRLVPLQDENYKGVMYHVPKADGIGYKIRYKIDDDFIDEDDDDFF